MKGSIFILLVLLSACGQSQDMPDGARDPRVVAYERRLFPGYGTCEKCGRPWNCCAPYTVFYDERHGIFALCGDCWKDCSIAERKKYYKKSYLRYVKPVMKDNSLDTIMKAVEKESQPKIK